MKYTAYRTGGYFCIMAIRSKIELVPAFGIHETNPTHDILHRIYGKHPTNPRFLKWKSVFSLIHLDLYVKQFDVAFVSIFHKGNRP